MFLVGVWLHKTNVFPKTDSIPPWEMEEMGTLCYAARMQ